jgi:hypothetical protein
MDGLVELWGASNYLFHYNENAFKLPFLADYTFGDALIIQNWVDYCNMQAIRWIKRHKGSKRALALLDPEQWVYDEDDGLTFYERLADVERNINICEMYAKQIFDLKLMLTAPEFHRHWYQYVADQSLNTQRELILDYRDVWEEKTKIIQAKQQRKRILEFASFINYKTLYGSTSYSYKENGITFYILKFVFNVYQRNRPCRIPPNQLECEEDPEWFENFM